MMRGPASRSSSLYMPLNPRQRQHLKALAHKRKPVIIVGAGGLSEAVLKETELSLAHHELLKIRLPAAGPEGRKTLMEGICAATGAEPVQLLGRVATIYRPGKKPRIMLPAPK